MSRSFWGYAAAKSDGLGASVWGFATSRSRKGGYGNLIYTGFQPFKSAEFLVHGAQFIAEMMGNIYALELRADNEQDQCILFSYLAATPWQS